MFRSKARPAVRGPHRRARFQGSQRRAGCRGGVLLDVVFALFVAAFVGAYGLSLMMTSSSAYDRAEQATLAYNAARQQIENVRSVKGALLANRTNAALLGPMPQLAQLSGGNGTLTIATYRSPVKQVTVTINWTAGGQRQNRSISMTTLVAAGGVTQ